MKQSLSSKTRRPRHDTPLPIRFGAFDVTKKGIARYDWKDPYHLALGLSWPAFFLAVIVIELMINTLFAFLYWIEPGSVANMPNNSLVDGFFFSIETLATVGYGVMAPQTLYGHVISATEIICGVMFTAIITGLLLIRFSRPRAKILYADKVVVTVHNKVPTLMLRIANGRMTLMTHAQAGLSALMREKSLEGREFRAVHELTLLRPKLPVFALTWTLMHVINEHSPLYGLSSDDLKKNDVRLYLSIQAQDQQLATQVFALKDYLPHQICFGMQYVDAVSTDAQGHTLADLNRLSLIEPENA